MIFVTVGNANQEFKRLLKAVDEMAGRGVFEGEDVIVQSGNNKDFTLHNCRSIPFMSMEEFVRMIDESNVVICHAGAGTLINVLKTGKVPVVMARRKKYGEHVDDHQVELVDALADEGRIIAVSHKDDLERTFKLAREQKEKRVKIKTPPMLEIVGKAIEEMIQATE